MPATEPSRVQNNQSLVGSYVVEQIIGNGRFGSVLLAHHQKTHEKVVIKMVDCNDEDGTRNARREVEALSKIKHCNIIRLVESFFVPSTNGEKPKLAIVLEYADRGELYRFIVSRHRLSVEVARHIFKQLVSALAAVHQSKRVHRDIKPENILLDRYLNVKLADFGLSTWYDPTGFCKLTEYCGSLEYAAPEILQHIAYRGPEVDIFSLGVVLYAMLCGRRPFNGRNSTELLQSIASGKFFVPNYLSSDVVDLLRRMLAFDPQTRATLEEIQAHPWVTAKQHVGTKVTTDDEHACTSVGYRLATKASLSTARNF